MVVVDNGLDNGSQSLQGTAVAFVLWEEKSVVVAMVVVLMVVVKERKLSCRKELVIDRQGVVQ